MAPKKGKRRRSISSQASAQTAGHNKDEMMNAAMQAMAERKENMANMRKNRAYQELKREMDQKRRAREKQENEGTRVTETTYVDRDRAAAVTIGSKDIKNDLKGKRRRDFRKKKEGEMDEDDEECDKETYFAQGRYELRHGDPRRALFYLNKAADAGMKVYLLFVYRSEANCILGKYDAANEDADTALREEPFSVPGLLAKAEAKYHQGCFEHALKYFFRAQAVRPDYGPTKLGINKAKRAIENSLSKTNGFDFLDMKEIIEDIVRAEEEEVRLAKEKEEMELKLLEKEICHDEDEAEEEDEDEDGETKDGMMTTIDLHKIMGVPKAMTGLSENAMEKLKQKAQNIKENMEDKKNGEKKICKKGEIRKANKQLLGKLHHDHQYLKSLLENPLLTKKYNGSESLNVVPKKILQCANEGLQYLDERKDFWQQQKPVYARRNELFTHQKSKQFQKKISAMSCGGMSPIKTDLNRRNALPSMGGAD